MEEYSVSIFSHSNQGLFKLLFFGNLLVIIKNAEISLFVWIESWYVSGKHERKKERKRKRKAEDDRGIQMETERERESERV